MVLDHGLVAVAKAQQHFDVWLSLVSTNQDEVWNAGCEGRGGSARIKPTHIFLCTSICPNM